LERHLDQVLRNRTSTTNVNVIGVYYFPLLKK
jgi:hypothetical protein